MAHRSARELGLSEVAIILYVVSLGLPALVVLNKPMFGGGAGHSQTWLGMQCLMFGYILWPGWLANPLFYVGVLLHRFGRHTAAAMTLVLAAASALLAPVLLTGDSLFPLEHIHVGYVAWLASIVMMFVATVRPPRLRYSNSQAEKPGHT